MEVIGVYLGPAFLFENGRKRLRSLYWKVRAEIRRHMKKQNLTKQRLSFHYDPFSYALNFDNGGD